MVTIGMNYSVLPGKEETFENAFKKVVHAMGSIDGHSDTQMYRNIANAQEYLIVSLWSDKGAFDGFIASDTFKNVDSSVAEPRNDALRTRRADQHPVPIERDGTAEAVARACVGRNELFGTQLCAPGTMQSSES